MSTPLDSVSCALNVGKRFGTNPHLSFTRDSTLEKVFLWLAIMENPLGAAQRSVNTKDFLLEQGSTSVANVGNP